MFNELRENNIVINVLMKEQPVRNAEVLKVQTINIVINVKNKATPSIVKNVEKNL